MRTITFYSYKGGVGRTLTLANVARYLATLGQKVFALDLDLEAPGLHYKLLSSREAIEKLEIGIVDYLHEFYINGAIPASLSSHVVQVSHRADSGGTIHLMPAGQVPSTRYWEKLSQINWHDFFYEPGARGIPFFLELKERVAEEYKPDYLLVDARTGITEIGGVATTLLPDQVICLLANNLENLEGARAVLRSIRRSSRLPGQDPVEILPVLTRLPKGTNEDNEKNLLDEVLRFLNEAGNDLTGTITVPEVSVLHSDPELQIKESIHIGSEKKPDESPLLQDYLRLFTRMIPREAIEPSLGTLLKDVVTRVLDDPEGTQRALETLTTFYPHPDGYRTLLKFYRFRRSDESTILRAAHRYWHALKDAREPLLWEIVSTSEFKSTGIPDTELASFVDAVWTANGGSDIRTGINLARIYRKNGNTERAMSLLLDLADRFGSDHASIEYIDILTMSIRRPDLAVAFARKWSSKHPPSKAFVYKWADAVIAGHDADGARALLSSPSTLPVLAESPSKTLSLTFTLSKGVASTRTNNMVMEELQKHNAPSAILEEYAHTYVQHGQFDAFYRLVVDHAKSIASDRLLEFASYMRARYG